MKKLIIVGLFAIIGLIEIDIAQAGGFQRSRSRSTQKNIVVREKVIVREVQQQQAYTYQPAPILFQQAPVYYQAPAQLRQNVEIIPNGNGGNQGGHCNQAQNQRGY